MDTFAGLDIFIRISLSVIVNDNITKSDIKSRYWGRAEVLELLKSKNAHFPL
jgi:hypothetical protein